MWCGAAAAAVTLVVAMTPAAATAPAAVISLVRCFNMVGFLPYPCGSPDVAPGFPCPGTLRAARAYVNAENHMLWAVPAAPAPVLGQRAPAYAAAMPDGVFGRDAELSALDAFLAGRASAPVTLAPGAEFTITGEDVPGDETEASTTYASWPATSAPAPRSWWTTAAWCSAALLDIGGATRETCGHRGRQPAGDPRPDQRAACAPHRRRHRDVGVMGGAGGGQRRQPGVAGVPGCSAPRMKSRPVAKLIEDQRVCQASPCPGWDSNPHCTVFETADSAYWSTGA